MKGLIDTVAMNENKGPWITVKGLIDIVTMNNSVSRWKTTLKQNPNRNVVVAVDYIRVRAWNPLDTPLMGSHTIHGPSAQIRWCSIVIDSDRQLVLSISADSKQIWASIRWHWKGNEIMFPTI